MNLTEALSRFTFTQDFMDITANARATISFWGQRCISVPGYEGTFSIDNLAESIIELVHQNHFKFTQEQRDVGAVIAMHITRLYNESDEAVANSCCFKRICCAIRRFFAQFSIGYVGSSKTTTSLVRWVWHDNHDCGFNEVFHYYTQQQFLEKFGREPNHDDIWSNPFEDTSTALGYKQCPLLARERYQAGIAITAS